jgi:diguanylate cyclase (GGDEF)-like protein
MQSSQQSDKTHERGKNLMTSDITSPLVQKPIKMVSPCSELLVISDQPDCTQALRDIFKQDHAISAVSSGDQAFQTCRNRLPDLILLDIVMPNMEGLEICRRLKDDPDTTEIPVIFLMAPDHPEAETSAIEAGAADIITQPIHPAVARSRVKTHLTLKTQSRLLESLAFIDGLTGIANRHRFDEGLEAEWRRCRRLITPLAILMIDIDHFKIFNEVYGHLTGDRCLKEVAAILKGQIGRSHDILARYSGEVFACLLPDIYFDGAMQKAEAMVRAVHDREMPHRDSKTAPVVTISIGVIVTIPGPDRQPGEVISQVKMQLSEAKQHGRNRVCGRELPGYFANAL